MPRASRFKNDKTPQQLTQEFLNMRISDLPGISQRDIENVLEDGKREEEALKEPRGDVPGDLLGNTRPWHEVTFDAATMTVREYMHFAAYADYYDIFMREDTRNQARKTHGELYEDQIDTGDDEWHKECGVPAPLRRYLTLVDALGNLADHGTDWRIPIKPDTMHKGLAAMEAVNRQIYEWANDHMGQARSAGELERLFYQGKAGDIYSAIKDIGTLPEWAPDALRARLSLADIPQRIKEAYAAQELEIRRSILQSAMEEIREAVEDTMKVDYRAEAQKQMDMARPVDAAARIGERLVERLEALSKDLGIPPRKREVE